MRIPVRRTVEDGVLVEDHSNDSWQEGAPADVTLLTTHSENCDGLILDAISDYRFHLDPRDLLEQEGGVNAFDSYLQLDFDVFSGPFAREILSSLLEKSKSLRVRLVQVLVQRSVLDCNRILFDPDPNVKGNSLRNVFEDPFRFNTKMVIEQLGELHAAVKERLLKSMKGSSLLYDVHTMQGFSPVSGANDRAKAIYEKPGHLEDYIWEMVNADIFGGIQRDVCQIRDAGPSDERFALSDGSLVEILRNALKEIEFQSCVDFPYGFADKVRLVTELFKRERIEGEDNPNYDPSMILGVVDVPKPFLAADASIRDLRAFRSENDLYGRGPSTVKHMFPPNIVRDSRHIFPFAALDKAKCGVLASTFAEAMLQRLSESGFQN
jgi:hypothetical protein